MERQTETEVQDGCGSTQTTDITLNVHTTTGGNFSIVVSGETSVEHLKKIVSKKLKVSKDRICLLYRDTHLREGSLDENGLVDGARVVLLPSVETGLLSQRPENSVMQALESLNDTQVNDFLSGKSPLNLTMRLGDHMMLIQLQLSTLNSRQKNSSSNKSPSIIRLKSDTPTAFTPQKQVTTDPQHSKFTPTQSKSASLSVDNRKEKTEKSHTVLDPTPSTSRENLAPEQGDKVESMDTSDSVLDLSELSGTSLESQVPIRHLSEMVKRHNEKEKEKPMDLSNSSTDNKDATFAETVKSNLMELLSKNKSLARNLINDVINHHQKTSANTPDSSLSDDGDSFPEQSSFLTENTIDEYPMENLFNSAVDKGLFENQDESMMDREISNLATTSHGEESTTGPLPSFQSVAEPLKNKRFQYLLHRTSKLKHPIGQNKQKAFMQSVVNKHKKRMQAQSQQESNLMQTGNLDNTALHSASERNTIIPQPSTSKSDLVTLANESCKIDSSLIQPSTSYCNLAKPGNSDTPLSSSSGCNLPTASKKVTDSIAKPSTSKSDLEEPETSSRTKPFIRKKPIPLPGLEQASTSKQAVVADALNEARSDSPDPIDSKALIEASKNLTQKLKKLSKEVLSNKMPFKMKEELLTRVGHGAVIESMKHHGKGIYSGTFSGTLNPALQDRNGRPKRDISTIIHILNDLLCATPPLTVQKDAKSKISSEASTSKLIKCSCSEPSCSFGQCKGHSGSSRLTTNKTTRCTTTDEKECICNDPECECVRPEVCPGCAVSSIRGELCTKCTTAQTLAADNTKTKCKLEQLRLVMQQKKQRREARKLHPYPSSKPHGPPDAAAPPPGPITDQIDTRA